MLITNELTRDVLCNELIELDKCIKFYLDPAPSKTSQHISNMVSILMSPEDMKQVDVDIWIPEFEQLANAIVAERNRKAAEIMERSLNNGDVHNT